MQGIAGQGNEPRWVGKEQQTGREASATREVDREAGGSYVGGRVETGGGCTQGAGVRLWRPAGAPASGRNREVWFLLRAKINPFDPVYFNVGKVITYHVFQTVTSSSNLITYSL
jgi:hypothetical protein